jgi:predicted Na+-dependent transporter
MSSTPSFISKLRTFLWDQHLPVGLVVMSIFGFLIPAPGLLLSKTPLNTISLLAIFFIGGLGLKTEDMKAAFGKSSIPSLLFGFISILAISPFLSFLFATDAFRNALGPIEFSSGMSLFAAMPTTVYYKSELKVTSSLFLISVPWMSMSAAADDIGRARFSDIVLLTIIGSVLHLVLLLFNYYSCDLLIKIPGLSIGLKEKKAVVISASQKTLNTAVSVIAFLPASLGDKGLITVPSIIAHCVQIIIDGFIVSWWKKQQLEQQQQQQQLPNEQQQEQQQQITNEKQQKVVIDGNNTNDSSRVNEIVVSESNLPVEAVEDSEVTQPPSGEGGSTTNNSNDDSWKNKGEVTLSGKL